jgi:signal transduction histidine kinase
MMIKHKKHIRDYITPIAKEYEEFVCIVSHSLSAPIRHIKEFTRLLIGARKENLSPEEQDYVMYLERSLQKLDDMQTALLHFSRLSTHAGEARKISLNAVVQGALEELEDKIKAESPEFTCNDLPVLTVDPKQMQLLFVHLIDNALKFHEGDSTNKKITISATEHFNEWFFEIRDNGIGIEPEHHDAVFGLFKKVEADRFLGMGVGLTLARKIVEHHGGHIFVESAPDKGTSICFTLPKI